MSNLNNSTSRSGLGSLRAAAPGWLTSMAEENTLAGLLESSLAQMPCDLERVVTENENTLFRVLEPDPTMKDLVGERTLEPLMVIGKPEPEKKIETKLPEKKDTGAKSGSTPASNSKKLGTPGIPKRKISPERVSAQASSNSAAMGGLGDSASVASPSLKGPEQSQTSKTKARTATSTPLNSTPANKRPKPQAQSSSKAEATIDARKKALRAAFSAFMHLHHPSMTPAEQASMLESYEGRETELWQSLAKRYGKDAVPARLLRSTEAAKGSVKIQLLPRVSDEDGRETVKTMKDSGIDAEAKETITRTTTVGELVENLEFRWQFIDSIFKKRNYRLLLFSVGSDRVLPLKAVVRDSIVDGCIEFCWCSPEKNVDHCYDEDSWGGGHSLAAMPGFGSSESSKSIRRIQPIPVVQEAGSKRIQADVASGI